MITTKSAMGSVFALAVMVTVIGAVGCGGSGGSRGGVGALAHADAVEVTYYYLPG